MRNWGTIGGSLCQADPSEDLSAVFGVRHAGMPLTPAQVWRAIQGRPLRADLAFT